MKISTKFSIKKTRWKINFWPLFCHISSGSQRLLVNFSAFIFRLVRFGWWGNFSCCYVIQACWEEFPHACQAITICLALMLFEMYTLRGQWTLGFWPLSRDWVGSRSTSRTTPPIRSSFIHGFFFGLGEVVCAKQLKGFSVVFFSFSYYKFFEEGVLLLSQEAYADLEEGN